MWTFLRNIASTTVNVISIGAFCKHKHLMFDSIYITQNGVSQPHRVRGLRCTNPRCFKFFPHKTSLSVASGAFAKIEQRLEKEKELQEILEKVKPYVSEF